MAEVLAAMPGTSSAIAAKIGVSKLCARTWCERLHASREAHIGGWHVGAKGGRHAPVYHRGPGADVVRADRVPVPKPAPRHKLPKRDPLTVALFGVR